MSLRKPRPEYFRVKKQYHECRGEKYFCHYEFSDKVVQICFSYGNMKKGRTNSVGIYTIHLTSFMNSYNQGKYLEYVTPSQFKSAFRLMTSQLKRLS